MKIGGLCFGYGGLDLAVQSVIPNAELAWYAEFDKGASKIGAHHWPDVPNHGDMTAIDWAAVEPVDILTGGTPCQDLSHAGKRAGMTEGTRSNLWVAMREAIAQIRPRLVVWENVGGAFSAAADSEVEPCAGCVGDGSGVHLRALGRVLGDLSALGYDACWYSLRAADVGAPHGRLRVFVAAYPNDGRRWEPDRKLGRLPVTDADSRRTLNLLPTPRAREMEESVDSFSDRQARMAEAGRTRGDSGMPLSVAINLLPTPAVNDMGASYTPDEWDAWTDRMKAEHGNGNGHGKSLNIEAQRLLPTPVATDAAGSGNRPIDKASHPGTSLTDATVYGRGYMGRPHDTDEWGDYAPAVHRWEALTRPAPPPTELGPKGNSRLSAAFSEWMMGLPAGWVTDVPDISRNEALKALGNGVVPQQAAAALREMFAWEVAA